jgi:hypothetical protein
MWEIVLGNMKIVLESLIIIALIKRVLKLSNLKIIINSIQPLMLLNPEMILKELIMVLMPIILKIIIMNWMKALLLVNKKRILI